jgi:hypothetical protein
MASATTSGIARLAAATPRLARKESNMKMPPESRPVQGVNHRARASGRLAQLAFTLSQSLARLLRLGMERPEAVDVVSSAGGLFLRLYGRSGGRIARLYASFTNSIAAEFMQ